ncbi:MAG: carbohydrate binding family 9 domain-containing protein [Gammaproteobacteria bacterium]|nr:carbohydrate binding family 9 domain-containing protein [Gammaproteobacteria bacterium]
MTLKTAWLLTPTIAALLIWQQSLAQDSGDARRPVPAANAHNEKTVDIPHTDQGIEIDGELNEGEWAGARVLELNVETRPGENIEAAVRTEAFLIEDGRRFLVAFKAYDPDPSAIRAHIHDRDDAWDDDFVGITIDTFNDRRRAYEFFVNPLGAQMDLTNDDVNGNETSSWDAIWESAGKITEFGYQVEIAIPFNAIRFQNTASGQIWGIDVLRFYPRSHRYRLSVNRLDRGVSCYLCQLGRVRGFEGVSPGRDLVITPTLTASRTDSTDDPGVTPLSSGSIENDLGVNVRWGLTSDLTLSATANPDFSQVEADVAQLDINNQFTLFFDEKRPFFLQDANIFDSPTNLVYTRNISDPDVGLKLTGKQGPHTYGLFVAADQVTTILLPGNQSSDVELLQAKSENLVGRYRRDFGKNSAGGVIFTGRHGNNYHNYVGAIDGLWRINDADRISFHLLASDTEYPTELADDYGQPQGSFSGRAYKLNYRHGGRDWEWTLYHEDFSEGFRADLGFLPRTGYDRSVAGLGRTWHGDSDNWWRIIELDGDWDIAHDSSGRVLEREVEAEFEISGPMQSYVEVGGGYRDRLWDDTLFEENFKYFYGEFQPADGVFIGLYTQAGDQIDFANTRLGDFRSISPRFNWDVGDHLKMNLRYTRDTLDTQDGRNIFTAGLTDARFTWQFSIRSFMRLTLQHLDLERDPTLYVDTVDAEFSSLGAQLLYSYKVNPQTVFFLGYADSFIEDDSLTGLERTDRTFFTKVGYAWLPD